MTVDCTKTHGNSYGFVFDAGQSAGSKSGWTFKVWYLDKALKKPFKPSVGIQSELVTLYGAWTNNAAAGSDSRKGSASDGSAGTADEMAELIAGWMLAAMASGAVILSLVRRRFAVMKD